MHGKLDLYHVRETQLEAAGNPQLVAHSDSTLPPRSPKGPSEGSNMGWPCVQGDQRGSAQQVVPRKNKGYRTMAEEFVSQSLKLYFLQDEFLGTQ